MSTDDGTSRSSAGVERHVMVDEGQNAILARASGSSWISLCRHGIEIVREASGEPLAVFTVEPGGYTVCTDGALDSISIERREVLLPALEQLRSSSQATLHISSDAPDVHLVDGVGEIPADGMSAATVTVQTIDAEGHRTGSEEEIFLRATGGVITGLSGETRIRSVQLESGAATFWLVSESSPRFVTVFAFSRNRQLSGELQLEFV